MTTTKVQLGDGQVLTHQDLTPPQRRFLRCQYLLTELDQKSVEAAIEANNLPPGTVDFVTGVAKKVMRVQDGEIPPEDILQLELERLEDAHMWSRRNVELTDKEKEMVVGWCRRDGLDELANDIQANLEKEREER